MPAEKLQQYRQDRTQQHKQLNIISKDIYEF